MRSIVLLSAALALTACTETTPPTANEASLQTPTTTAAEPTAAEPAAASQQASLEAVLAAQPETVQARYTSRNPAQTLAFFGIEPGMTVVEALPGGQWS